MYKVMYYFFAFLMIVTFPSCEKAPEIIDDTDFQYPPVIEKVQVNFQKSYGGEKSEFGLDIVSLDNDDMILLSKTYENGNSNQDILVHRINQEGEVLWKKTYGTEVHDWLQGSVLIPNDGIVMFSATTEQFEPFLHLIKIDYSGNILWENTLPGRTEHIIPTRDGGFAFLNKTDYPDPHIDVWLYYADVEIVKLDALGQEEWRKTVANIDVQPNNIGFIQSYDGRFVLTATYYDELEKSVEYGLFISSESGDQMGKSNINTNAFHRYLHLVESDKDEFIMCSTITTNDVKRLLLSKFNKDGLILDQQFLEAPIYALNMEPLGEEYLITGFGPETESTPHGFFMAKCTRELQFIMPDYDVTIEGASATSGILNEDGSLSLVGYSYPPDKKYYYDVYYLKLRP